MTSDKEREELERLREIFSRRDGTLVFDQSFETVYLQTHHPELVEEDERYKYEGKLDDTPPGIRLERLGTYEQYGRFQELLKWEEDRIMKQLHQTQGYPRLEIDGAGKPSIEVLYMRCFPPDRRGRLAVYVLSDYYDERGSGSINDFDYITFQQSALERLIKSTLESELQEAKISTNGMRTIFQENLPYGSKNGYRGPKMSYEASVQLILKIVDWNPSLTIEFPKVNYPTKNGTKLI